MYINSSNSVLWNSNIDSMDLLQGLSAFFKLLIKYWPGVNVIFLLLLPLTSRGSIDEFSKQNVFYIRKKGRYILERKVKFIQLGKSLTIHSLFIIWRHFATHHHMTIISAINTWALSLVHDKMTKKPSEVDAWCP